MYYLGSRYYDPVTGRFVNADDPALLLSGSVGAIDKNLYAYCDNNPINRIDDGGEYWNIVAGAVIGGAISVGMELANQVISSKIAGEKVNWTEAGKAIAISAVSGAIGGGNDCGRCPREYRKSSYWSNKWTDRGLYAIQKQNRARRRNC
ncbi:MAG: RHS repeat-associated core domain-containing protein [Lachnoclostridium sp.]